MFEDISSRIRDNIQTGMKERFGLSESESERSLAIMLENIKQFFTELSAKGNVDQLRRTMHDWTSDTSSLKEKFNRKTISDLMEKAGLSEETANRVMDFSVEEYMAHLRKIMSEIEERMGFSNLVERFKVKK